MTADTQLHPKPAKEYISQLMLLQDESQSISEEMMKAMLNDDNLEVKSEVEVCEMLMKWLQVQTEAGHDIHPDQLLPLIRWSGVSVDYVKSKLLQNTILTSDPASVSFLSKVMTYLQSGVQFEGLQTFHRSSTGLDNCLVVVGLYDGGNTTYSEVECISFQRRNRVKLLTVVPTKLSSGCVACLLNDNLYTTGTGDKMCQAETWTWNLSSSDWIKCAGMLTCRQFHCAAVVNSMLYVLGGWIYTEEITHSSVECYNTKTNIWSSAGHLIHAVCVAACVTYKNLIYVFGGLDKDNRPVAHVQIYNPAHKTCTLMDKPMPCAYSRMRAVLWDTSVILFGYHSCYMYNFETETWQKRKQFKASVAQMAVVLANSTVYIAGGCIHWMEMDEEFICTDEIKSVSVLDIMEDKPALWKHHARLPKSAMINAFISTSLIKDKLDIYQRKMNYDTSVS